MLLVGLSGSLGSGKSTVGTALAARGAAVIDTDRVAREVLAPGTSGVQAVFDRFGPGARAPDGSIDRQALATIVFADPGERAALEAISHPRVHEEVTRRVAELGDTVTVVESRSWTPPAVPSMGSTLSCWSRWTPKSPCAGRWGGG